MSEGWRGGGARVQAVRPAGDGPPKAPRDYVYKKETPRVTTVYRTNDGSLKSECVCGGMRANGWVELVGLRVLHTFT